MTALEDIHPDAAVRGIVADHPVRIVSVEWIGNQAVNLVYRQPDGDVSETTLYREDECRLGIETHGRNWSFDGDAGLLRLVTEADRIALAHHFDPYLAIHTSLVDPLPHQISAVYGEMLTRQPLRFLLADDPGAGKTIMAGLLIKELQARGDLERCLIIAPGNLVEQWQDELGEKFGLEFDILTRDMIESSRSGNPFDDCGRLIARLDMLARNEELQERLIRSAEWDLIVCDEAHRMSASYFGGEIKYTKRYRIGQLIGGHCRHLLLMTATPHNGKEEDFQLFMALLDADRFEGRFREGVHRSDTKDMMRRLTKEELLRFDARPLFPERRARTAKYELSPGEAALYTAVTDYVRNEMDRVARFAADDGRKRVNVGFALQILQRRLASSPAAIHQSLRRRRERLESELGAARRSAKFRAAGLHAADDREETLTHIDEYEQREIDDLEDLIVTRATTAATVEQLGQEVETLKAIEKRALDVLHSGQDTKWSELDRILDDPLMIDADGNRRKLVIFTEPKDTLHYLRDRIQARLGTPDAVAVIHGGVTREERRNVVERFMQDRGLLVLVANDAAGEGVNLQRGHLMVNYDLPWNPNRIEQRFGRIHRIGQTEVCHLWNLVADGTREGEVYARLLDKLETARKALGGRVYDVLGELFEGRPLKDLLVEAIQYGESDDVRARLFERVDGAVDQEHLMALLRNRALTKDTMPEAQVEELRLSMERAEAQRLQPCHVQSFFVEAFQQLGGHLKPREEGRWEITHVPAILRERDRQIGTGTAVQTRYERICFEKNLIHRQPVAAFVYPGHPLLEAVIGVVREKYGYLMKKGAVYVDDSDHGEALSVVVLLEHDVRDGRTVSTGRPHIVSKRLQFAAVGPELRATDAGIAPHLNLRPAHAKEIALVEDLLAEPWLRDDLERAAVEFATVDLARAHVTEVRARRLREIEKVEREVDARLTNEINHWDLQAFDLKERQAAGEKVRLNWENAERRASELAERRKRRMALLEREKHISSLPPRVRGGMVVIPRGLLDARAGTSPTGFSRDAAARARIEIAAMEAVMRTERDLGNSPEDVSARKIGYDVESYDPDTGRYRLIEVKGRVEGAESIMITRQEIITSLHEPERYILAFVEVSDDLAGTPRYVRGAMDAREPPFDQDAIQFNLKRLLERAEEPS